MDQESLDLLAGLDADVELVNESLAIAQVWIPFDRIDEITELPEVKRIDAPKYSTTMRGSVLTEGDAILLADRIRAMGLDGAGVKVGVISDGANDRLEASQSDDLPENIVSYGACLPRQRNAFQCDPGRTCNEGTAMLEIIHDIAPKASLAMGAVNTSLEFIQRIDDLANDFGADIIVDDLGFFGEPFFADGTIAQAVAAVADEVLFVSSAGNSAHSHYEGEYRSTTFDLSGSPTDLHDFGQAAGTSGDGSMDVIIGADTYVLAILQWNDRFGSSANDYDLWLANETEDDLLCVNCISEFEQSGAEDPIEAVCYYNSASQPVIGKLAVRRYSGSSRRFEMFVLGGDIAREYNIAEGSVFGHSAVPSVLATGTINAQDEGNDEVAFYSSRGPARIDFPALQNRPKPDVLGIDGVSVTGAGDFPSRFFGTSAAAPHVAGVAALLKQADAGTSPLELRSVLNSTALDLGVAGHDNVSGHGRIDAAAALNLLAPDLDGDGLANSQDNDNDNDGVPNAADALPLNPNESLDTDFDGIGNNADTDDDDDGFDDLIEISVGKDPLDPDSVPEPGMISFLFDNTLTMESEGEAIIWVTRLLGEDFDVEVDFSVTSNSALAGVDFEPVSGVLRWEHGDAAPKSIAVPLYDDDAAQGGFALTAMLSSPSNVKIANDHAVAWVLEDDFVAPVDVNPGVISTRNSTALVSETAGELKMEVVRYLGSDGPVSVQYELVSSESTIERGATIGVDLPVTQGTVSWADGETSPKQVTISIVDDEEYEPLETAYLILSEPSGGAALQFASTDIHILDDSTDARLSAPTTAGAIAFGSPSFRADENEGELIFNVLRLYGRQGDVSVSYTTLEWDEGGTREHVDFSPVGGTFAWVDGDDSPRHASVPILSNTIEEPHRLFFVVMTDLETAGTSEGANFAVPYEPDPSLSYAIAKIHDFDTDVNRDTDGDGVNDVADLDDDNDGVRDVADAFPRDPDRAIDTDGDGIDDNIDGDDDNDGLGDDLDNCPLIQNLGQVDSDSDGLGDSCDDDDDNDGVVDDADAFPLDANESVDTDGDGVGNNADPDDDGDTVEDTIDEFPLDAAETADWDSDGTGDVADPDDDNDGVDDEVDAFPVDASETIDTDGDGIGNNADTDDDGDGVPDSEDAFPLDLSETTDTDGDGVGDNSETPMRLEPSQKIELPVTGRSLTSPEDIALTVPSDATAVSLNVTAVNPDGGGYVTVWPCSVDRPLASNLNYVAGDIVPNGVIAPVGSGGKVCFYSFSKTDVVVDIAGWFEGDAFIGTTPQRLVDTRNGTGVSTIAKVTPSSPLSIQIGGIDAMTTTGDSVSVPSAINAASLNVTVVNPAGGGFVTVYPCDVERPLSSNVNFVKDQVVANGVVAPVSSSGQVCIYASTSTDIVVDLAGWFANDRFVGATPNRRVDTREGTGGTTGKITNTDELSIPVHGITLSVNGNDQSIPAGATAAALNVTAVDPNGGGFITVYPCGVERPLASNLNYIKGDVVANNVIAPIGADGSVCIYSSTSSHVVVDIAGWFEGDASNGFVASTPNRLVDTRDATGPAPQ